MKILLICGLLSSATALFFGGGGGGGGCCCGCGTPQPASCGCGGQSVCPPPQPCPSCAAPVCPPPQQAICPQVQPIYIPASSCSGGGCGGGGGYGSSGYASSSGGGYATSSGIGYAPAAGGVGYAPPASGYASSGGIGGGSSGGYSAPVPPPSNVAAYAAGGGGGAAADGYQQHVVAAVQADDPKGGIEQSSIGQSTLPALSQPFRNPICEPQKIKYVVLRAKKLPGRPGDEMEEEAEEVERPAPLEATASPLDAKEVGDELLHNEEELGDADGGIQARAAATLSDAKCNSKPLRDLIMENIIRDDALASKRQIHETSIKRFPEHTVDVICSTTGFTYLVSTTEHCEAQRENVICFVYKRPI